MVSESWIRTCRTCETASENLNKQKTGRVKDILRKAAPDKEIMIDELERPMKNEA